MKFSVGLDEILDPLQLAMGAVDRKNTLPILSHLFCTVSEGLLTIVGSDRDLEISAQCSVQIIEGSEAEFTLPGRKLLEVCRYLSDGSILEFALSDGLLELKVGQFRSQFATLPATEYPLIDVLPAEISARLPQQSFKELVEKAAFAMAQQDVRYFFNGMLFEFEDDALRVVATNGQRLAVAEDELKEGSAHRCVVPRKAVLELLRLIKGEGEILVEVNRNHFKVQLEGRKLVTHLVDAEYPDYTKAIPSAQPFNLLADRVAFRSALTRISILSNEVYRNVKLELSENELRVSANNPLQEEAEEVLDVEYSGDEIEIGFNVGYIIDALSAISGDNVEISLSDGASPVIAVDPDRRDAQYVISPMVI